MVSPMGFLPQSKAGRNGGPWRPTFANKKRRAGHCSVVKPSEKLEISAAITHMFACTDTGWEWPREDSRNKVERGRALGRRRGGAGRTRHAAAAASRARQRQGTTTV